MHDRLGLYQSGPTQQAAPVRPVTVDLSDQSNQRPGEAPVPRMEYRIKEKKEEPKPTVDAEKLKTDVVQIRDIKVATKDAGKGPMIVEKSVDTPVQRPAMANDHKASRNNIADKYHQPRWCHLGLTHTQKRKL